MNDDIIVHYGVKGMKWGIRKRSRQSKDAFRLKTSRVATLSNAQLQRANKRMKLEQDFNKYRRKNLTDLLNLVGGALKYIGPMVVSAYATKAAANAGHPGAQAAVKLLSGGK